MSDDAAIRLSLQAHYNEAYAEFSATKAINADLLAALELIEAEFTDMHSAPNGDDEPSELRNIYPAKWALIDQARAAIAKAKGETR